MSSPNQTPDQGDSANGSSQESVGFEKGRSLLLVVIITVMCAAAYLLSKSL